MMVIKDQQLGRMCVGKDLGERGIELQYKSDRVLSNPQGALEQDLSIRVVLNLAEVAGTCHSQLG